MSYNKNEIDADAEREAAALSRQDKCERMKHIRLQSDYNIEQFEKLFKV